MKYAKIYLVILLLILAKISLAPLFENRSLGSAGRPIQFMLTPSVDAEKIVSGAEEIIKFLHEKTGYHFHVAVPASYVAVVEALGSGRADIAGINTFSYVLANQKYGVEAVLKVLRRDGEPTYKGQIITRTDSGIDSLSQLKGKRMAYVDPASTSGYILPKAMLKELGVKPAEEVFAAKHDNVVMMVYQKQVDAGATYYSPPDKKTGVLRDARERVVQQFPDVATTIKIIGFTMEIPNDPFVVRSDFPKEMKEKIVQALMEFQHLPNGKKALAEIFSVEGFAPTNDAEYNGLRKILEDLGYKPEQLVKK